MPNQTIALNRAILLDLLEAESGDLMRLPAGTHIDISSLVGRIAKQRLQSGRPIRISAARGSDSVLRAQAVKIVTRAPVIIITNQGEAMRSADVESSVQVKTAQGKIIQAVVSEGDIVTVSQWGSALKSSGALPSIRITTQFA